jgi:hypothetical protein
MALSLTPLRRYATSASRDPHYKLKATLATGYIVSALALPFVPPLLETRRAKRDGSWLTRYVLTKEEEEEDERGVRGNRERESKG